MGIKRKQTPLLTKDQVTSYGNRKIKWCMKNIIFMVLSVLLLVSCSKELRRALIGPQIEPVCDGWYRGHHYLVWGAPEYQNGVVHDPDCPCHLDTLSIYVVDKNDTTYIIEKK